MKARASTGDRHVLCARKDCAFTGDMVSEETVRALGPPLLTYYVCEAEIVVLDRRVKFGKTCGRYARRG